MPQITKRFAIDRHGSSDAFVLEEALKSKVKAKNLAAGLRRKGHLVRVTKLTRTNLRGDKRTFWAVWVN